MKKSLQLSVLMLALCAALPNAYADEAALLARINQLDKELQSMRGEIAQLKQAQQRATKPAAVAPLVVNNDNSLINGGEAIVNTPAPPAPANNASNIPSSFATAGQKPTDVGTSTLFGYGELNYGRTRKAADTQADASRVVVGVQHRFSEKTKFVAELELEHGVSSASDKGEVEVEQAYIEHQISDKIAAQGGLFLIPMGLLNESHEPTAYHGVNRNFVETAIIPTTWREGGLKLIGQFDNGITLQGGVGTTFNLNKWDATSSEGQESPLGSIHQEMSQASAKNAGFFAAADWRGVPGLRLGTSAFAGNIDQGTAGMPAAKLLMWDVHGKWNVGQLELAALYARATISNTAAWNAPLVGNATLIPSLFDGGYVQAAYKAWENPEYSLTPFVRAEWFNTGRRYADLGAGITPDSRPTERVLTLGTSFGIGKNVVLKTDYQWFKTNSALNRLNVGLGWAF